MTSVVISQPLYFAWPGFIDQLSRADVVIWLDDVQFSKGSFVNRNRIVDRDKLKWLSIPLRRSGSFQTIGLLQATDANWRDAHQLLLKSAYFEAPFIEVAEDVLGAALMSERVCDIAVRSCTLILEAIEARPGEVHFSSNMGIGGHGSERVRSLVQAVGGSTYITGHGAAKYLQHRDFEEHGIQVAYMDYRFRPWRHGAWSQEFGISSLDLIAQEGFAKFRSHLMGRLISWRDFLATRELIKDEVELGK